MKQIIRTYKKGAWLGRKLDEKKLAMRGYYPISEEEISQYSGGKGIILALIFLPLALLGHVKKIRVIYQKDEAVKN